MGWGICWYWVGCCGWFDCIVWNGVGWWYWVIGWYCVGGNCVWYWGGCGCWYLGFWWYCFWLGLGLLLWKFWLFIIFIMFILVVFIFCILFLREFIVVYSDVLVVFWMVLVFGFRFCVSFVNRVWVWRFFIVVGLWWIRFFWMFCLNLFMSFFINFCELIFKFVVFFDICWMNFFIDLFFFCMNFKRLNVWCDIGLNWLMKVVCMVVNDDFIVVFSVLNYVFVVLRKKKGRYRMVFCFVSFWRLIRVINLIYYCIVEVFLLNFLSCIFNWFGVVDGGVL